METAAQLKNTGMTWRSLLYLAAVGDMLVLIYMVVVRGDTLALALGAVFLLGLALLRFRSGVLGILAIGLLSADIAVWTVSGTVSNFLSGEDLAALVLPGYLGVISLMGLLAAVATWITRDDPERGAGVARRTGQVVLGLLLVITVSGLLIRRPQVEAGLPTDITLSTENMRFSHTELSSENGQVTVHLSNKDLWWHTFTIDELGVDLKVPMGAEREVTFSAPPGTYRYYCAIPGHEPTMHGTLTISE